MAGLSHNPAAEYCTKRGTSTDPDAVCDYCKARGLGPQEIGHDKGGELPSGVNEVENNTGEPEPVGRPQLKSVDAEQGKPEIVAFFEKIGIVKGGKVSDLHTTDGRVYRGTHFILDINGYLDREIVLTLQESGVATRHRVVWGQVVSFIN